jgi:hypothetical protein
MSKYYQLNNLPNGKPWQSAPCFGKARGHQQRNDLENNFSQNTLYYLSENIINHLMDSTMLWASVPSQVKDKMNDYSFLTAPAYKAFEGFLFQIARDLQLPSSGNPKFAGTYFDEEKVDKAINKLLKEFEQKAEKEKKLSKQEKDHIKDMVKEMKRFLYHYRHTPAHFDGEPIQTIEMAQQNVLSMYRIINETTKTLLDTSLLQISEDVH